MRYECGRKYSRRDGNSIEYLRTTLRKGVWKEFEGHNHPKVRSLRPVSKYLLLECLLNDVMDVIYM